MTTKLEKAEAKARAAAIELERCHFDVEKAKLAEKAEDWGTVSLRTVLDLVEEVILLGEKEEWYYNTDVSDALGGLQDQLKSLRTTKK